MSKGEERDPYLYSGLEATLYDELDELAEFDDAYFFRWFIDNFGGPVLDVGCGTGRLLVPFAKEGIDVEGLDASDEMLEICRGKLDAIGVDSQLHHADMRRFELERKYQVIMIPGFSLQLLTDEEDAIACLQNCKRHLLPGGVLIVCTYVPWEMIYDGRDAAPFELRKSCEDKVRGVRVEASQAWELNREDDLLVLKNRFETYELETKRTLDSQDAEMTLRWRLPYDFVELVRSSGFDDISTYGDFEFDEMDPEAESVICVGHMPDMD